MTVKEGRAPSQRQLRVGEALRHALADILMRGELRDPALQGASITVSEVRVSPDLRNATAFVVPLGGGHADEVLAGLRRAGPHLRAQLARAVRLKFAPALTFKEDTSFDYADRIDRLLHTGQVARDLGEEDEAGDRGNLGDPGEPSDAGGEGGRDAPGGGPLDGKVEDQLGGQGRGGRGGDGDGA